MIQQHTGTADSYLQAALKKTATKIKEGTTLPIPTIPESVKHAPAERILIFQVKTKGAQLNKKEQEIFRNDIREVIGEEFIKQVMVIRPTRYSGHTIIFQNKKSRDEALQKLCVNEATAGIDVAASCIIAPKHKYAKTICREPPENYPPEKFLSDLSGLHNPHLHQIPLQSREARIIKSETLGWIFELSSREAQVFYTQNGRIRFGYGREIKVEEFISVQQCYKCCAFGHNAAECTSKVEYCRLCGKKGHAGKDYTNKDDKNAWSCINCRITNEVKGYKLPTNHTAA